jgi:hypothetical protein
VELVIFNRPEIRPSEKLRLLLRPTAVANLQGSQPLDATCQIQAQTDYNTSKNRCLTLILCLTLIPSFQFY